MLTFADMENVDICQHADLKNVIKGYQFRVRICYHLLTVLYLANMPSFVINLEEKNSLTFLSDLTRLSGIADVAGIAVRHFQVYARLAVYLFQADRGYQSIILPDNASNLTCYRFA